MTSKKELTATPLLLAVGIIAICGIIYELMIGAISSYLLGNSVKQYSITIGLFMSAMGVGSYVTKYIKNNLFDKFIIVEIIIGVVGGFSAILLFMAYGFTESYHVVMYCVIIVIGIMVGIEIPLLTRIIEESKKDLRMTIANVLSVDYIGALVGSMAFPLLLLPSLGEIRTSFLVGGLNLLVAFLMINYYGDYIHSKQVLKVFTLLLMALSIWGFVNGDDLGYKLENRFYRDKIIVSEQTQYQKIVLTQHKDDLRLYLDGNIQFSSVDEHRYHEALIHPAMNAALERKRVLILGGGDGMAAREILKYEDVDSISLVDLDPGVVDLCRKNPLIKRLNQGALDHEKVTIYNQDAFKFLEDNESLFDVIIVDLPDPNNEALSKLYSTSFYRLVNLSLTDRGLVTIQSTSPLFANEAYWCIRKTVAEEFEYSSGYHMYVPSFGDWGYSIASKSPLNLEGDFKVNLDFLTQDVMAAMFVFAKDEAQQNPKIKSNRLTNPVLIHYYQRAWQSM